MDDDKLVDELRKAKEELFNLRFQSATGQLENHGRLRAVRKDIARIYTEMRERELGIAPPRRRARPEHEREEGQRGERRPQLPQDPSGLCRQRQDGQDRRRRGRGPRQARPLRQGHAPLRTRLKAHDEANESAGIGDRVLIMETRPLSATKRWRVVEILEKAK
jgi:large subunit ribosomal protein L29